ncbi:MAG: hypothetical protein C0596_04290 [Marinilabiliales bacterium]|nr:MAG: hypothetical protein C0596_04290 [Marinilabiliales bacterium]
MNKKSYWIFLNSFFAFVSAFIFIKAIIVIFRFLVIRYFNGSTQMDNFEIDCITWKFSSFWNQTSVISIYIAGFFIACVIIVFAYILYRWFRTKRGFFKLWFTWLYIFAISQSFGIFLRDIPFRRDIYHALNWMYFPYWLMIVASLITIPAIIVLNFSNDIKFLRMSPGFDYIRSNIQRRRLYTKVALLPSIFGSIFILFLHFNNINLFEIVEKLIIIAGIVIAYFHFSREEMLVEFRIVKNEPIGKPGLLLIILFILSLYGYLYLKNIYF